MLLLQTLSEAILDDTFLRAHARHPELLEVQSLMYEREMHIHSLQRQARIAYAEKQARKEKLRRMESLRAQIAGRQRQYGSKAADSCRW